MREIQIRLATIEDLGAIEQVDEQLFDYPVKIDRAREFLSDHRHHLVLATCGEEIVGMASAFHYVHPDKDPTLFVNEVSVLQRYRNQGIARAMVRRLCEHGRGLGCREAWVATEDSNLAARRAYVAAGGVEDEEPVVLINLRIDPDAPRQPAGE